MYILTKDSEFGKLFYQFSESENDLYCVLTDTLNTCRKYSEEDMNRLKLNPLLTIRNVKFQMVYLTLNQSQ